MSESRRDTLQQISEDARQAREFTLRKLARRLLACRGLRVTLLVDARDILRFYDSLPDVKQADLDAAANRGAQ